MSKWLDAAELVDEGDTGCCRAMAAAKIRSKKKAWFRETFNDDPSRAYYWGFPDAPDFGFTVAEARNARVIALLLMREMEQA